ncbi:MAG: HD domain-containing phosphohydrolase [Planctomycetota bacterium]
MPLVVTPDQAEPGMKLLTPVRRGAAVMLPGGRELSEADLERLVRRFPQARLTVADAALDAAVEFEDDSQDVQLTQQALEHAEACVSMVGQEQKAHPSKRDRSAAEIERQVDSVASFLVDNPVGQVVPPVAFESDSYLSDHMSAVFHLAMLLGVRSQHYVVRERLRQTNARDLSYAIAESLMPLGLGALYMDVAMDELEDLDTKAGPLTDADWQRIREHPIKGARRLPDRFPPAARMVVMTHHQSFDGTGYPDSRGGEKLHVFTRIVRLCDAFDAATSPRPWRPAKSIIRALWELSRGPYRGQFDPELVKALLKLIQPFPVGTKLKLSDGRSGVVCERSTDPFEPIVAVAYDETGRLMPAERIESPVRLMGRRGLHMTACGEEDLGYVHERAASAALGDDGGGAEASTRAA